MAKNILKKKQRKLKQLNHKQTDLMNFIIFSVASAFFFALTFFLRKQAGKIIPVTTAYFIETCVQMVLMILILFFLSQETKTIVAFKSAKGYIFASFAGITVVAAVFLSYLALKFGLLSEYQAITSPAQILFAVLVGMLLLSESFTLKQMVGMIISIIGILLIIFR